MIGLTTTQPALPFADLCSAETTAEATFDLAKAMDTVVAVEVQ